MIPNLNQWISLLCHYSISIYQIKVYRFKILQKKWISYQQFLSCLCKVCLKTFKVMLFFMQDPKNVTNVCTLLGFVLSFLTPLNILDLLLVKYAKLITLQQKYTIHINVLHIHLRINLPYSFKYIICKKFIQEKIHSPLYDSKSCRRVKPSSLWRAEHICVGGSKLSWREITRLNFYCGNGTSYGI